MKLITNHQGYHSPGLLDRALLKHTVLTIFYVTTNKQMVNGLPFQMLSLSRQLNYMRVMQKLLPLHVWLTSSKQVRNPI